MSAFRNQQYAASRPDVTIFQSERDFSPVLNLMSPEHGVMYLTRAAAVQLVVQRDDLIAWGAWLKKQRPGFRSFELGFTTDDQLADRLILSEQEVLGLILPEFGAILEFVARHHTVGESGALWGYTYHIQQWVDNGSQPYGPMEDDYFKVKARLLKADFAGHVQRFVKCAPGSTNIWITAGISFKKPQGNRDYDTAYHKTLDAIGSAVSVRGRGMYQVVKQHNNYQYVLARFRDGTTESLLVDSRQLELYLEGRRYGHEVEALTHVIPMK